MLALLRWNQARGRQTRLSGPPSAARRPHSGFSLLELLVVLVIVGIIAAAATALQDSPFPAAVKTSTSSLHGALRNAQTLALASGQQVYLRPSGGGAALPRLDWGFRILNADGSLNSLGPAQGTWTLPPSEARYVSIGVGDADLTAARTATLPRDVPAVAAHAVNNATLWSRVFFTGGSAPADAACPFFSGNGAINQEFFVTVTGARLGNVAATKNRMGLIVVSPRSGISAFSKQDPDRSSPPWSRL